MPIKTSLENTYSQYFDNFAIIRSRLTCWMWANYPGTYCMLLMNQRRSTWGREWNVHYCVFRFGSVPKTLNLAFSRDCQENKRKGPKGNICLKIGFLCLQSDLLFICLFSYWSIFRSFVVLCDIMSRYQSHGVGPGQSILYHPLAFMTFALRHVITFIERIQLQFILSKFSSDVLVITPPRGPIFLFLVLRFCCPPLYWEKSLMVNSGR